MTRHDAELLLLAHGYTSSSTISGDWRHMKIVEHNDQQLYWISARYAANEGGPTGSIQLRARLQAQVPEVGAVELLIFVYGPVGIAAAEAHIDHTFWRTDCLPLEGHLGDLTRIAKSV